MMKKQLILLFFVVVFIKTNGQPGSPYVGQTKMVLKSEDKFGKAFDANTSFAYMSLNLSNGDFILNADASTLRTGDSKLDTLLLNNGLQTITFKGNINESIAKFNEQINDENMHDMSGVLTINNISVQCTGQFDPISYSDKGDVKNYRLDFKVAVDAAKFIIKGLENNISKQITLEVMGGKLNTTP